MKQFETLIRAYLAQSGVLDIQCRGGLFSIRDMSLTEIIPYLAHITNIASRVMVGEPSLFYTTYVDKMNLRLAFSRNVEVINQAATLSSLAWVLSDVVNTHSFIQFEDEITSIVFTHLHGDELEENISVNNYLLERYQMVIDDIRRDHRLVNELGIRNEGAAKQ